MLNKLSVFLMSPTIRNIVCQRRSAVNFDALINGGKILLANLSTGLLTEKVAGMFGSFLVTKIVNAAFRRANVSIDQRRPWYLYVDPPLPPTRHDRPFPYRAAFPEPRGANESEKICTLRPGDTTPANPLANDSDGGSGNPLTATLGPDNLPQHGRMKLNANGTFEFVPHPDFLASMQFITR